MPSIEPKSALAAYVRWRLKKEEAEHGRGYQADLARRSRIWTAHIANLLNRDGQGVGMDVGTKLARVWGMTFAQLADAATEWARSQPPPETSSAFPNLEAALAFMASRGPLGDDAVQRARRIAAVAGDLSAPTWIALLHDVLAAERSEKS